LMVVTNEHWIGWIRLSSLGGRCLVLTSFHCRLRPMIYYSE
jgi:hypothetical protein